MIEIRPDQVHQARNLTPDGLESDIMVIDSRGREVPYVSPEARAAINAMNAEDGLPLVAATQPELP